MKTRYKIIISTLIVMVIFYVVPPNIAGYTCNELDVKDIHCHVVGMNFLGIKINTNLWYVYNWQDKIGCGGVLAHPDKAYPCSGMESYWGLPTEYARYMEMEHYIPNKNQDDKTMKSDLSLPSCASTRETYNEPPTCVNEYWPEYPNYIGEIKDENNTIDQIRGVLGNCACQERVKANPDTMERCIQPHLSWENSTHYIDNNLCEWIEK